MVVCLLIMTAIFWGATSFSIGKAQTGGILVDDVPPQLDYVGDANNTDIEWELDGAFTAIWDIVEDNPDFHFIFWNQSGVNSTYSLGSYTTQLTALYDPGVADVGNTIYFQLKCNDTQGFLNSSIVFFSVVNTNPPTVTVQSPENITYTTESVLVTLACPNGDLDTLWFSLYYTDGTPIEENTTWTSSVSRELDQNERYYIIGYANDSAGLEASPDTVYFTMGIAVAVGGQVPATAPVPPGEEALPPVFRPSTARRSLPFIFTAFAFVAGGYWYIEKAPRERPEEVFAQEEAMANRELAFLNGYFVNQKKKNQKKRRKKRRTQSRGESRW
jgi:hypothetical protein